MHTIWVIARINSIYSSVGGWVCFESTSLISYQLNCVLLNYMINIRNWESNADQLQLYSVAVIGDFKIQSCSTGKSIPHQLPQ